MTASEINRDDGGNVHRDMVKTTPSFEWCLIALCALFTALSAAVACAPDLVSDVPDETSTSCIDFCRRLAECEDDAGSEDECVSSCAADATLSQLDCADSTSDCKGFLACVEGADDDHSGDDDSDGDDDTDIGGAEIWTDPKTGLTWQTQASQGGASFAAASGGCDALELGGYDDWRLPTISELRGIVLGCTPTQLDGACTVRDDCPWGDSCWIDACLGCDEGVGPINGCYWPPSFLETCATYNWSSTPVEDIPGVTWVLHFDLGRLNWKENEDSTIDYRCVRSNESEPEEATWTDSDTGLMWQVTPHVTWVTFEDALNICDASTYGGHDDWRVPSITELRTIVRGCSAIEIDGACAVHDDCPSLSGCYSDSVCLGCGIQAGPDNGCYWPDELDGTCVRYQWSSTSVPDRIETNWVLWFGQARIGLGATNSSYPVRCVRGEMTGDDDDDSADDDTADDDDDGAQTWTDTHTGLTWQTTASTEKKYWQDAVDACDKLRLAGYKDWRLPTISEFRGVIEGCPHNALGGECRVTDECTKANDNACYQADECENCVSFAGPDDGCYRPDAFSGECDFYQWSATTVEDKPERAWVVKFQFAHLGYAIKDSYTYAYQCVRP